MFAVDPQSGLQVWSTKQTLTFIIDLLIFLMISTSLSLTLSLSLSLSLSQSQHFFCLDMQNM